MTHVCQACIIAKLKVPNYLVKTNSLVRPLTAVDDDVAGYAGCRHDIQRCVLLQNGADRLEGCLHHRIMAGLSFLHDVVVVVV